jgi:hypothetical protein
MTCRTRLPRTLWSTHGTSFSARILSCKLSCSYVISPANMLVIGTGTLENLLSGDGKLGAARGSDFAGNRLARARTLWSTHGTSFSARILSCKLSCSYVISPANMFDIVHHPVIHALVIGTGTLENLLSGDGKLGAARGSDLPIEPWMSLGHPTIPSTPESRKPG